MDIDERLKRVILKLYGMRFYPMSNEKANAWVKNLWKVAEEKYGQEAMREAELEAYHNIGRAMAQNPEEFLREDTTIWDHVVDRLLD